MDTMDQIFFVSQITRLNFKVLSRNALHLLRYLSNLTAINPTSKGNDSRFRAHRCDKFASIGKVVVFPHT